ncbi:hypothetical protein FOXYSP1_11889 [Fusarium oxysporum f. sp. phaseoli]
MARATLPASKVLCSRTLALLLREGLILKLNRIIPKPQTLIR